MRAVLDARGWAPVGVVGSCVLALWLGSGVSGSQVLIFCGYELGLVLVPGWLLYRAIVPAPGEKLWQLVCGWTLGYLIEVGAFVLSAAAGLRWLLSPCQAALAVAAAMTWWWGQRGTKLRRRVARRGAAAPVWALAVVCVLVLAYQGVQYVAADPLPANAPTVAYPVDLVWALSLAAEARHHWPVADPTVSGQPLYYHLFATFDAAAIAQATGLSLPLVFLRLYLVVPVLLAVAALAAAGKRIARRAWAGPLSAALVLLVWETNLDVHGVSQFGNELADDLIWQSPSFLFSLLFLAPALALLYELCGPHSGRRRRGAPWLLLGLLLIGCAAAKATTLPVLIGGLVLYLLAAAVVRRPIRELRPPAAALVLAGSIYAVFWLLSYTKAGSYGLSLDPPGAVRQMTALARLAPLSAATPLRVAFWAAAVAVGLAGAYGPVVAGLPWALRVRRRLDGRALLAAIAVAGLVPYLAFTADGASEVYFAEHGLIALAFLSALGLCTLWRRARAAHVTTAAVIVCCLATAAAVAGAGMAASSWQQLAADLAPTVATAFALAFLAAAMLPRARRGIAISVATALVMLGFAARAVSVAGPALLQLSAGQPLYSQLGRPLTPGLRRALVWVRDHTPPSAVIAVNNDELLTLDDRGKLRAAPANFYYSAFAERPTFLEGWLYSQRAFDLGEQAVLDGRLVPFPQRLRLQNAVFRRADRSALRLLSRRYGVRYLFVDRVHGKASPCLAALARPVFNDAAAVVYRVSDSLPTSRRGNCARFSRSLPPA